MLQSDLQPFLGTTMKIDEKITLNRLTNEFLKRNLHKLSKMVQQSKIG
jgi:hypothetical protein